MKFGFFWNKNVNGISMSLEPDNEAERQQLITMVYGFPQDLALVCQGRGTVETARLSGAPHIRATMIIEPAADLNQAPESPERRAHERKPQ